MPLKTLMIIFLGWSIILGGNTSFLSLCYFYFVLFYFFSHRYCLNFYKLFCCFPFLKKEWFVTNTLEDIEECCRLKVHNLVYHCAIFYIVRVNLFNSQYIKSKIYFSSRFLQIICFARCFVVVVCVCVWICEWTEGLRAKWQGRPPESEKRASGHFESEPVLPGSGENLYFPVSLLFTGEHASAPEPRVCDLVPCSDWETYLRPLVQCVNMFLFKQL